MLMKSQAVDFLCFGGTQQANGLFQDKEPCLSGQNGSCRNRNNAKRLYRYENTNT